MELRLYRRLLRRRWIAILLLTVLGAAAGAAAASTQSAAYETKAALYLSSTSPGSDPAQAYQGALLAEQQASSYTSLLTDDHVLRSLIGNLHLPYSVDQLKKEVNASNSPNTAVIRVTVKDPSAQRALAIANAYGPVFSGFMRTIGTSGVPGVPAAAAPSSGLRITTLQPQALTPQRVSPPWAIDIVLGVVAGLVLGIGWAVVREVTDTRIRDAEDAVRASGVPVLGAPAAAANGPGATQADGRLRESTAEAYRRLSFNIQSLSSDAAPLMLVMTGPRGGEGTTTAATELAIAFAERGDRVVLVDADLRRVGPGRPPELPTGPGLQDVLAGRVPLAGALQMWRAGLPLSVLPNGAASAGPFDMMRKHDIAALRDQLAQRADVVIFIAPPLLQKTDAVLLARVAGRALVMARAKATRSPELRDSVGCLQSAGVAVLGVVLTGPLGRSRRSREGFSASEPVLGEEPTATGSVASRTLVDRQAAT